MNKKNGIAIQITVISVILIISVIITVLNVQMVTNVTTRQTEEVGALEMNNIRSQLQQTLDQAAIQTYKSANDVELLILKNAALNEIAEYLKAQRVSYASDSCINVYVANPDWYVIPDFDEPDNFDATTRGWYIGAAGKSDGIYISEPYMDLASDNVCFTVSKVLSDGKTVVALDYKMTKAQNLISEMEADGRTALIVTEDGQIAGYADQSFLGKPISEVLPEFVDILNLEKTNKNQVVLPRTIGGQKQTVFCSKTENDWYLILCVNNTALYLDSYRQLAWLCLVNFSLIIAIVTLYLFTVRSSKKAENALNVKDQFLKNLSSDLKLPISSIMNNSNPDISTPSSDTMTRIRESALKLQDMVNNMFSYSEMLGKDGTTSKNKEHKEQNLTKINKRVRLTIIIVISIAMIVSVSLFTYTSIRFGNQQLAEDADHFESELSQWIIEQKSILGMFCNAVSANPEILNHYDECIKFFDDITQNYKDISVVYMTNPEAEHTVIMNNGWQPDEGWHVETRQWYIDTMASKDGFNISAPYFDSQTGLYCITFSQRVYDANGEFLGNFGIDFYMDKLTTILGESYSDTGYAFLVDNDGNIINHPYAFYQMNESSSTNIWDTEYKNAYADVDSLIYIRDYDDVNKVSIARHDTGSQFTILVVKNWWSIYGNIVIFCTLFVLMFAACVFAVYYLISKLMKWQESVNQQLEEAVATATAAGKAKSQFLAQMSHEIRTPINAVLGMNEMILRESTTPEIKSYSYDIQSAGRTLLSLINSILDFSKIEDGKMEIVDVEYDTVSMINDLVNMISERAAKKGLELKLEIDETLPMSLFGDDLRIRQVITNLLTNAVKYTERGQVVFKMHGDRLGDGTVLIKVAVSDTGIGIKEEDKEYLGQSFARLDQEKNHNIEGTGLGLSIVSKLLQMMNSTLKIDSIYGEGSTFYFEIVQTIVADDPIGDFTKRHRESIESMNSEAYLYAPTASILVVDDNDMNLKVACGLMKRNGIYPDTASGGLACISAVESKDYDIIFLDHMMPGMDGIETLKQLKSKNLLKNTTTVIALTANAVSGARDTYIAAGFMDYLSKPIDVSRLEHKLQKYLPPEKITMKSPDDESDFAETETANSKVEETSIPSGETNEETTPKLINYELGLSYCANMEDIYIEAANAYIEESEEKISKLDEFYEARDWKNYAIIAHAIKSTSLTLGAETLSALAKEHEFAAKEERGDDIDASYFELLELYQAVLIELKNHVNGEDQ